MTTIVNNPGKSEGVGLGLILGVILAVFIVGLFLVYGIPALRNNSEQSSGGADIKIELPTGNTGNTGTAEY